MLLKPITSAVAAFALAATAILPATPAFAGNTGMSYGNTSSGPKCTGGKTGGGVSIYKPVTINKSINIYKPVDIQNNINIYKPVTIDKNINIYKPVTINKIINADTNINIDKNVNVNNNVNINKNININKNVNINKTVIINKGGGSSEAEASAFAAAQAQSSSSAGATATPGSSSMSDTTVNNYGGGGGAAVSVAAQETCHMQEASVVKAIHVMCVAGDREFPASHMIGDTWISASYEGEVARCIPGATIKAVIGDVLQSDQGMAGTYSNGQVLMCGVHEALRHFKDGMLRCAPAVPVPDCTERTNLRRYGTGDLFFSYRAQVCVSGGSTQEARARDLDLTGMSLEGGVSSGN
jgi:hypothetical protein